MVKLIQVVILLVIFCELSGFQVLVVSSSRSVPIVKATTQTIPVRSERVPEKNQWDIAPVMKLIPIYLIIVEK